MELVLALDDEKFILTICDHHHAMVKEQVENYNLSHFIVKNESDVFDIIERALTGSFFTDDDFDPLLMMDFLLWQKAIEFRAKTGIDLSEKDGKPTCIMCEYENIGNTVDEWLKDSITRTLNSAKQLGLFSVQ